MALSDLDVFMMAYHVMTSNNEDDLWLVHCYVGPHGVRWVNRWMSASGCYIEAHDGLAHERFAVVQRDDPIVVIDINYSEIDVDGAMHLWLVPRDWTSIDHAVAYLMTCYDQIT